MFIRYLFFLLSLFLTTEITAQRVASFNNLESEIRQQVKLYWRLDDESIKETRIIVYDALKTTKPLGNVHLNQDEISSDFGIFGFYSPYIQPQRVQFFIKHHNTIIILKDNPYDDVLITQIQTLVDYFKTYKDAPRDKFYKYLKVLIKNKESNMKLLE